MNRTRSTLLLGIVGLLVLTGAAQAKSIDGYRLRVAVAHDLKNVANETPEAAGYAWRYSKVSCSPGEVATTLSCNGVGRWQRGWGRPMTSVDWTVLLSPSGAYTATSTWTFTGHVWPQANPFRTALAADIRQLANKIPEHAGYKWRYVDVSCAPVGGFYACNGVGKLRFGWGKPVTAIDWNVSTEASGDYTATAIYKLVGSVDA